MTTQALVTQENINQKLSLMRFGTPPNAQALVILAQAAVAYDLDPVLGEITYYEGKPYITCDGWYRKVSGCQLYDGEEKRTLSHEEAKPMRLVCCPEAVIVGVKAHRKGRTFASEAYGRACSVHVYRGNATEKAFPYDLALKRARVKAYRLDFRDQLPIINLPTWEDADTIEGTATATTINNEPVNPVTGELPAMPAPARLEAPAPPARKSLSKAEASELMTVAESMGWDGPGLREWLGSRSLIDGKNVDAGALDALRQYKADQERAMDAAAAGFTDTEPEDADQPALAF